MAIRFRCTCGSEFQVADALGGQRGQCSVCGGVFTIPARPDRPAPAAQPPSAPPLDLAPITSPRAEAQWTCEFCGAEGILRNEMVCPTCSRHRVSGIKKTGSGRGAAGGEMPAFQEMVLGWVSTHVFTVILAGVALVFGLLWLVLVRPNRARLAEIEQDIRTECAALDVFVPEVDLPWMPFTMPEELAVRGRHTIEEGRRGLREGDVEVRFLGTYRIKERHLKLRGTGRYKGRTLESRLGPDVLASERVGGAGQGGGKPDPGGDKEPASNALHGMWQDRTGHVVLVLEAGGSGWITFGGAANMRRSQPLAMDLVAQGGFQRENVWIQHSGGGTGGIRWSGTAQSLSVSGHKDGPGEATGRIVGGHLELTVNRKVILLSRS